MILDDAIRKVKEAAWYIQDINLSIVGPNGQTIIVRVEYCGRGEYSYNVEYLYTVDNQTVSAKVSGMDGWPDIPNKLYEWSYQDQRDYEGAEDEDGEEEQDVDELGIDPKFDENGWRLSNKTRRAIKEYVRIQKLKMNWWLQDDAKSTFNHKEEPMKFEKVKELYSALDTGHWSDEERLYMEVFARTPDATYLVVFGRSGRQGYVYKFKPDQKLPVRPLENGIPFYGYEYGLFLGGEHYADLPEKEELKPYDKKSGDVGILDIPSDLDWNLINKKYFRELAQERADQAGYELRCAHDALELL